MAGVSDGVWAPRSEPFWAVDICCEGSIGPCRAEMADAADGPDEVEETG
jgi:hypothetical protein